MRKALMSFEKYIPVILMLTVVLYNINDCHAQQPNVLLIISDDQGIGDFGFMGNKHLKTPNLDRLADQSAVFKDFIVAPACSPTRSSLMTGRNHLKAGVWGVGARNNLMRDEALMAEYFKAAGYGTGYFGKRDGVFLLEKQAWHWGCDEVSHVMGYKHKDATSLTHKGNIKRKGWTCDVDVDNSLEYIERQGDKPWWCATAFILPHLPWEPDDRFAKPYRDAGHSDLLADFYGCVTQLDDAIGRLLKGLEDLGQADNTIVLFLSDNGPSYRDMSEKDIQSRNPLGLKGTKSMVWENGIVVPFMVRWPQQIPPGERSQYGTVEDIVPTLIDLTGMQNKLPAHLPFDGISLRPALVNPGAQSIDRQVLRVAISFEGAAGGLNNGKRGIVNDPHELGIEEQHLILRGERYKYHNFADGTTALYDIKADPGERKDISKKHPQIADYYKEELQRQYDNIVNTDRAFRMPVVVVGEERIGTNSIAGAMANKAFGLNEILRFHFLKGFTKANNAAEYKVIVEEAGTYDVSILGQNLGGGEAWELECDNKHYFPAKADEKHMIFEKVKFLNPGIQQFTIKVNKDGNAQNAAVVEHIKFK
ncbi:MAG: sulfatase-like hydrolase/transferase [Bacteroidetes bacterium]|nr:sulfatase-like hydrolase/transferase [Bacteroidota bacterium]